MPQAGFEPATPATERPKTYALDSAAIGIGDEVVYRLQISHGSAREISHSVLALIRCVQSGFPNNS
jgi:hypothetical protein